MQDCGPFSIDQIVGSLRPVALGSKIGRRRVERRMRSEVPRAMRTSDLRERHGGDELGRATDRSALQEEGDGRRKVELTSS